MKIKSSFSKDSAEFQTQAVQALDSLKSQSDQYGFLRLPQALVNIDQMDLFQQLKTDLASFDQALIIGIGGSGLGAKWLIDIKQAHQQACVLDNPDPILIKKTLRWIKNFKKLVVMIISKSGRTIETLTLAQYCLPLFEQQGLDLTNQVLVITEEGDQPLNNWAQSKGIKRFQVPLDVGGRYSILSVVGLAPAIFLGYEVNAILKGAQRALIDDLATIELIAQSLASFNLNHQITVFWTYGESLKYYGDWLQQLWGESLGKPGSKSSVPLKLHSAQDQHSMLQLLMEGEFKIWTLFVTIEQIEDKKNFQLKMKDFPSLAWLEGVNVQELLQTEQQATAQALINQSKLVTQMILPDLSEDSLGYLIMLSEIWVAALGLALKINPFDQPGVELGKKLVKDLIRST